MSKLFKYFTTSLLFMLIGFFVGLFLIPIEVIAVANIIMLFAIIGLLIFTLFIKSKKKSGLPKFSMKWVYGFAALEGALLYPTLMYYLASLGVVLFLNIILGTLAIFGILAYIGHKQESGSFIGLGKILFVALAVLIVLSLINVFLQVGTLSLLLSIAGIVIFSAYVLFDVNQFKTAYEAGLIKEKDDYSIFVLNIFTDFINLLLDILNVINRLKD